MMKEVSPVEFFAHPQPVLYQAWKTKCGPTSQTGSRVPLLFTDDESDAEEHTQAAGRCTNRGVSSKLRIADTTVVHQVTSPHEVVYPPSVQQAV